MDCVCWFKFLSNTCGFGWGFLLFGCFRQIFNLICVFLFINFGLKVFQFGYDLKSLFDFSGKRKNDSFSLRRSNFDHSNEELRNTDDVFEVLELRKLLRNENFRAENAYNELEKERISAATATDETMAMILRMQNEKSLIEMEFKHFRRLAQEKQIHDQEVIQSLRWIVNKHELERSHLEEEIRLYKERVKIFKGDSCGETDERMSFFNSRISHDGLISSLDFDTPRQ